MAFQIIIKTFRIEDTVAFIPGDDVNGLRDILRNLSFYHLPFRFESVFGKTADRKTIIHPLVQTEKKLSSTTTSNLNMSKLHDS